MLPPSSMETGVCSAGFNTLAFPAAMRSELPAAIMSGKFPG